NARYGVQQCRTKHGSVQQRCVVRTMLHHHDAPYCKAGNTIAATAINVCLLKAQFDNPIFLKKFEKLKKK
ncbi:LOW QUALITY PROTEIN: hypothetical protein U9M48_009294, partial [Paspalum notatum var. saurae]